jgi:hypothetical protein
MEEVYNKSLKLFKDGVLKLDEYSAYSMNPCFELTSHRYIFSLAKKYTPESK